MLEIPFSLEQLCQAINLEDRFVKDRTSYWKVPHLLVRRRRKLIEVLEQAMAVKGCDRQIFHKKIEKRFYN